jgi:hypothetical protein
MTLRRLARSASAAVALLFTSCALAETQWIRPASANDPLVWGRRDGIVFGLPSPGGMPGPRGLIRVGLPGKGSAPADLVNFVAIEPVATGAGERDSRMAFSELEPSTLDPGQRGKRLWVGSPDQGAAPEIRGTLTTLPARPRPVEELTVRIEVERYTANGAHVYLFASMYSDRPQELELEVHAYPDSAPLDELTVTATMGNYERLRWLWLKDRIVESRKLYRDYREDGFIDLENYPLEEMLRTGGGDAIALATTDEADPTAGVNPSAAKHWRYMLPKLTQYWRVPSRHIQPDLRVKVNGRRVYWASHDPIPGGIAFENFELRQRYMPGQVFIFGLTPRDPWRFEPRIPRLPKPPEVTAAGR